MENLFASPLLRRPRLQALSVMAAAVLMLLASASHAEMGPFTGLDGKWSGSGTVSLGNGTKERIICRATYAVSAEGNKLQQSLRCASDSYRFELTSDVTHQGGQLSGVWSEASRNISGTLFGSAKAGRFDVVVTSPTFSTNLSLTTQGDRQSVVATAPPGGQLVGASIMLARGK
jgi:hypothetical protein